MKTPHCESLFYRMTIRKKVLSKISDYRLFPRHQGTSPFIAMGEITVDPKGVLKLLNGLKVHKVTGPDGLSARVLKECSSEIAPILAYIYNESLAQGNVPDDWRQANVAPVFKKGEKYDPANYRPVSLTCICCKTLEHIIVSNINKHLSLENILADCQHGFGPAKPGSILS